MNFENNNAHNVSRNSTHSTAVLQRLFTTNFRHVQEVASGSGLFIWDTDRVVEATATQLHLYTGPDDDSAFREWVTSVTAPATDRIARYLAMRNTHSKIVRKGIWSVIRNCSSLGAHLGNLGKGIVSGTVEDLEQTVWTKVFEDFDRWSLPGYSNNTKRKPAKLSTRLYAFARLQAMGWRTDRIRARAKFVPLIDDDDGVPADEKYAAEHGKLRPRPIVLGPGDVPEPQTEPDELPEDFFAEVA